MSGIGLPKGMSRDEAYVQGFADGEASAKKERLAYLRGEIEAERISYSEIHELQGLVEHIDPSDVVLLQWAGVPEHGTCPECGEPNEDEEAGRGRDEPHHLHCDFCTKVEHAADLTSDWNGETGNHRSCELHERHERAAAANGY